MDDDVYMPRKKFYEEAAHKRIEFPLPVVLDRPNSLKIVNKQVLVSFTLSGRNLPLHVSSVAGEKSKFIYYLTITKQHPDQGNYDFYFKGNTFLLTVDAVKHCIEKLMRDPARSAEISESLAGKSLNNIPRTKKRSYGFRTTTSSNWNTTRTEASTRAQYDTQRTYGGSTRIMTDRSDLDKTLEGTVGEDWELNENALDNSLLSIMMRIYSTSPAISLTLSATKHAGVRKKKVKDSELFSKERVEAIEASIASMAKKRIQNTSQSSLQASNYKLLQSTTSGFFKPTPNKVLENISEVKNFAEKRLFHIITMANELDFKIKSHKAKALFYRHKTQKEKMQKIKEHEVRRSVERSIRVEQDRIRRVVPMKYGWLVLCRMATVLQTIESRYQQLYEQEMNRRRTIGMAIRIQRSWRKFFYKKLPHYSEERRHLNTRMIIKLQITLQRGAIHKRASDAVGLYLNGCFQKLKIWHIFLQSVLYIKNVSRRVYVFLNNQRENVQMLMKMWTTEVTNLARVQSSDKEIPELVNFLVILSKIEEHDVAKLLKQLYKIQWLAFLEQNSEKIFGPKDKQQNKGGKSKARRSSMLGRKANIEEKYLEVESPTSKSRRIDYYLKKAVPVGQTRVLDILTDKILKSPENSILVKVNSRDAWLGKVEDTISRMEFQKRKNASSVYQRTRSIMFDEKAGIPMSPGMLVGSNNSRIPSETEFSLHNEHRSALQQMVEQNQPLSKFLEKKFDLNGFKVSVSATFMRALILETIRFYKRIEFDETWIQSLNKERSLIDLPTNFIEKIVHTSSL